MKHSLIAALAITVVATAAHAQHKHAPGVHTPKHGGVVVEVRDVDLELVAKPDSMVLHVSDHGKPVKLASAGGKVTVFSGNEKVEALLSLAGDDRLEAKGSFKVSPGTKVLAEVSLNGKPTVAARFTLK